MQRTLNRESKELEIVGREAIASCEERRSGRGLAIYGDTLVMMEGRLSIVPPCLS